MRRLCMLATFLLASACQGVKPNPAPLTPTAPTVVATPVAVSIVASPGELPSGGGSAMLHVHVRGDIGPATNVPVTIEASTGALDSREILTDTTGHARVRWTGTETTSVVARAGDISGTLAVRVAAPPAIPPPAPPPPPSPAPTPTPTPTPPSPGPTPVTFAVTLARSHATVPVGSPVTFAATPSGEGADPVIAYQWDVEGDGTFEGTTTGASRTAVYDRAGVITPTVKALTAGGRTATGTAQVIITQTLR